MSQVPLAPHPEPTATQADIVITPKTIQVGAHVYPTQNLCHFGPGWVPKYPIETRMIVLLAVGLLVIPLLLNSTVSRDLGNVVGFLLFAAVCAATIVKVVNPKRYGLTISLASGEHRFFPTTDEGGLAVAVDRVRATIESIGYVPPQLVTVNETNVSIRDTTVTGLLNTGQMRGPTTTHVGRPLRVDPNPPPRPHAQAPGQAPHGGHAQARGPHEPSRWQAPGGQHPQQTPGPQG